jgi:quercetin dioxygenase-like cupin family protein
MSSAQDSDVTDSSPITRTTLQLTRLESALPTAAVEIRRITLAPGFVGGFHVHNGPVFGSIVEGSVIYQIAGESETVLRAGDVFYEPANLPIARFDATEEGVVFLAYFLLEDGQVPEITMGRPEVEDAVDAR